jgi:stearoyl-CoA desaturase (delta-9 desaturase)
MGASDPADMPEQAPAVVHATQKLVTAAIVAGPAVALAIVIPWLWGHAVNLSDIVIGIVFYVVTGFGLTIGCSPIAASGRAGC